MCYVFIIITTFCFKISNSTEVVIAHEETKQRLAHALYIFRLGQLAYCRLCFFNNGWLGTLYKPKLLLLLERKIQNFAH